MYRRPTYAEPVGDWQDDSTMAITYHSYDDVCNDVAKAQLWFNNNMIGAGVSVGYVVKSEADDMMSKDQRPGVLSERRRIDTLEKQVGELAVGMTVLEERFDKIKKTPNKKSVKKTGFVPPPLKPIHGWVVGRASRVVHKTVWIADFGQSENIFKAKVYTESVAREKVHSLTINRTDFSYMPDGDKLWFAMELPCIR